LSQDIGVKIKTEGGILSVDASELRGCLQRLEWATESLLSAWRHIPSEVRKRMGTVAVTLPADIGDLPIPEDVISLEGRVRRNG